MPELSILFPSIRPELARSRIEEFLLAANDVDFEIILVSPFPISLPRVVHLPETERRGVIHAMNVAYRVASAPIIMLWSDDARPLAGSLQHMLQFVRLYPEPMLAGFRKRDVSGRESEQWSVYGRLYVGWLCAKKTTIDAAGGLFDPAFRNFWADPDLSLRVLELSGKVQICPNAWLELQQAKDDVKRDNLSVSFDSDTEYFFSKWHEQMGGGRKVWWLVNTPIPYDLTGRVRKWLRQIPYLKETKDAIQFMLTRQR